MLGNLARRGATGAVQRLMSAIGGRGAVPDTIGAHSGTIDAVGRRPQRVTAVRVFRQAPSSVLSVGRRLGGVLMS